jgi:DeoR/GlpR family transcriptional regulator of sugar metabolism
MIEHADAAVVLVDRSKLEARGLTVIGRVGALSTVLAAGVDGEDVESLAAHGVRVQVVTDGQEEA